MKYICGCGLENRTLSDWVCHWKYSINNQQKLHAIWLFLTTKIEFHNTKSYPYWIDHD